MQLNVVCKVPVKKNYNKKIEGLCAAIAETLGGIYIWNEEQKPSWDMFYEYNPSVIICLDQDITQPLNNAIKEYGSKLVCLGSKIPEGVEKPFLVCSENPEEGDYYLKPAANLVDFISKEPHKKYESDVVNISEDDSPIAHRLEDFRFKSFSIKNKLKNPNYIGRIEPKEIPSILSSSKVYLDFHGDEDMICACMANKIPCLSASNTSFDEKIFPKFGSTEEFINGIRSLIMNQKFIDEHVEKCYSFAMKENTYFHRASDIFSALGYKELAQLSLDKIKEYL